MEKVLVVCHLTGSKCNGQEAKTTDVIKFLEKNNFEVDVLNYGKLNAFGKVIQSNKHIKSHKKIIIMPGGKRALYFYINLFNKFKDKEAHYVAVGGWVLNLLQDPKNKDKFEKLKKFKGIYLQNEKSVNAFKDAGFDNVHYISNFSNKAPISDEEIDNKIKSYDDIKSYNFCFFARVKREKGVLLACDTINKLNDKYKDKDITLDIFGEITDDDLKQKLEDLSLKNPNIQIKGVLSSEEAIKELSKHYCMLFPTFYKGEGTPHTIIESFMAGLPVIASNWAYNSEVVENGKTGLLFELNSDELFEKTEWVINHPEAIKSMSKNCFVESKKYNQDILLKPLVELLNK